VLRASLIGFGVTLVCVLTPLLHLLLGLPGPFIGGIVGGIRVGSQGRGPLAPAGVGALLGGLMALTAVTLGGPAVLIVRALGLLEEMTVPQFLLVPLAVGAYTAILGTAGAFLGAIFGRRKSQDPSLVQS
jgi:hypothetical protein